jgi:hypothetical protein
LTPLKFNYASYTTNLPVDTKYFLTSLSLAATKIIIENGVFSIGNHPGRVKEEAFPKKERKIGKKGGELIQIVNGFIRKGGE